MDPWIFLQTRVRRRCWPDQSRALVASLLALSMAEAMATESAETLPGHTTNTAGATHHNGAPLPSSVRSSQTLYKYADADGRTVYSNRAPAAGIAAATVPYAPTPPRRPEPPVLPQKPVAPIAAMPRPQPPLPPERDRQQQVIEALARQIEALQGARKALKEGEAVRNGDERNYQRYLDRIQGLRDAVVRQEGVVEMLQGQLRLFGAGGLDVE